MKAKFRGQKPQADDELIDEGGQGFKLKANKWFRFRRHGVVDMQERASLIFTQIPSKNAKESEEKEESSTSSIQEIGKAKPRKKQDNNRAK